MKTKTIAPVPVTITEGLTVNLTHHPQHVFLMSTKDVAHGFGVLDANIRKHKSSLTSELVEGKHFIQLDRVTISNAPNQKLTYWTKRGIVRLGFFIKSQRAKLFRDWAEDYIIESKGFAARAEAEVSYKAQPSVNTFDEAVMAAAKICGSQKKLAQRLGVSDAMLSLIRNGQGNLFKPDSIASITDKCRGIVEHGAGIDIDAIDMLMKVEDKTARLGLYKKLRKAGALYL